MSLDQMESKTTECHTTTSEDELSPTLEVKVMSFGYKEGPPPQANMVFDVRFLKNPYWVEELRPLTGLDRPVQEYVLNQAAAQEFLESIGALLNTLLPRLVELEVRDVTIAFGCTGGQHRSTTLAETLADRLVRLYPEFKITRQHRELG
jgi:RNase adapter protein RapZ